MILGDPLPAIREWLIGDPPIVAASLGGVVHRTPEPLVLPLIRVTRIGGGGHRHGEYGEDIIRLQVDVFADWQSEPVGMALANLVRDRLHALNGAGWSYAGVSLCCPHELSGPSQSWDESRTPPLSWVRLDWSIRATTTPT